MIARHLFAAALALGLAAPAAAHDAQRVKLVLSVNVAASPAQVWSVIGNFQDMSWDCNVLRTTGQGGNIPNKAIRSVTLKSGMVLPNEDLERYEPQHFTYATFLPHVDVRVLPVTNYSSILDVVPGPDGTAIVEWRSAFYRGYPNFGPPPELNEAAAIKAVTAMVKPALACLKSRFDHHG